MRVEREEPGSIGQFWFNCTAADGSAADKWPTGKNGGRTSGRNGKILQTVAVDDESSSAATTVIVGHDIRLTLLFTLVATSALTGVRF